MAAVFDPCRRPGLAYQHAFDWLAVQLQATSGPIATMALGFFATGELLRRLPSLPMIPPAPMDLEQVAAALDALPILLEPEPGTLAAVAWVEPTVDDVAMFAQLQIWLQPCGRLYLVAGGRLSRFLAERRADQGSQRLDARRVVALLRRHDFRIRQQIGLHGPRAIACHYAGEAAGRFDRPALRDRAHFSMRRDFVEAGLGRHLSALTLIVAEWS